MNLSESMANSYVRIEEPLRARDRGLARNDVVQEHIRPISIVRQAIDDTVKASERSDQST
jgi:hypothetical protein